MIFQKQRNKILQNLDQRIENSDWNFLGKLNFNHEIIDLLKRYSNDKSWQRYHLKR